jgi:hypothetical protein
VNALHEENTTSWVNIVCPDAPAAHDELVPSR